MPSPHPSSPSSAARRLPKKSAALGRAGHGGSVRHLRPWIAGAGAGAGAGTGVAVPSSGDVGAAVGKGSIAEEPVAAPVAEETEEQVEGEEAETEGVAEAEEEAEDVAPVDYAAASDVEYEDEEDETWAHIEEVVSA